MAAARALGCGRGASRSMSGYPHRLRLTSRLKFQSSRGEPRQRFHHHDSHGCPRRLQCSRGVRPGTRRASRASDKFLRLRQLDCRCRAGGRGPPAGLAHRD